MTEHRKATVEHQPGGLSGRGLNRIRYVCTCGWMTDWQTTPEFATQQLERHQENNQ